MQEGDAEAPRHTLLFAAGTGMVPMLQIVKEVLDGEQMQTLTLLCSNKTYADLLCWDETCSLARRPGLPAFRAWLAFSSRSGSDTGRAPSGWPLAAVVHQRIDRELVVQALAALKTPLDSVKLRVVVSGPEGFFASMRKTIPTPLRQSA